MPPSYVANPFANPAGAASKQAAQSSALRTYAPNPFAGSNPQRVTSMAPHLSVAEADRPYADDIALLREGGYGDQMPDLDRMWRFSPHTYQSRVAELLRQPDAAFALGNLKNPPPPEAVGGGDTNPPFPVDPKTGQYVAPPQYDASGQETDAYREWLRWQLNAENGGD